PYRCHHFQKLVTDRHKRVFQSVALDCRVAVADLNAENGAQFLDGRLQRLGDETDLTHTEHRPFPLAIGRSPLRVRRAAHMLRSPAIRRKTALASALIPTEPRLRIRLRRLPLHEPGAPL